MASRGFRRPARVLPSLILALGLLASVAAAGPVKPIGTSGAQVTVPDGWTIEVDESGQSFSVVLADPSATLTFISVPEAALTATLGEVDKALTEAFTDLKLATPEKTTLNGIPCLVTEGTGHLDGITVEIGVLALWPSPGQAAVVFGVAEQGKGAKAQAGVELMFRSITRVPGAAPVKAAAPSAPSTPSAAPAIPPKP